MARPPSTAPHARFWWWCTLLLAGGLLAASALLVADWNPLAAVGYGVLAAGVLALFEVLRRRHRDTARRLEQKEGELAERVAEIAQRDAQWRAYTDKQCSLLREETEHLLTRRLPAALAGEDPPAALYDGRLGDAAAESLGRVFDEVADSVAEREESQRLAMVALAGRVQTSAHRIQATVSGLAERHATDPDILDAAMHVDHAATQQARHAQSLKVLCGEWPGQQWRKPMALVDVVRAASGRIVAYKRIEVTGDPDIGASAPVVEPLIHLVAELLANATEYSPPKTQVPVTVRTVQRGAVVEIDDGGIGLDEYRLGQFRELVSGRRLISVSEVGEIPQTGFAVVGQFAHRHGFQVDLAPSPYGGVRVVLLITSEGLEALEPAGAIPARRSPASALPTRARSAPQSASSAPGAPAAPVSAPQSSPEVQVPEAPPASEPVPEPTPELSLSAGEEPIATRPSGLPQRRSSRGSALPSAAAPQPAPAPPSQTPEEAGDWMGDFIAGGQSASPHTGPTPDSPKD